MYFKCVFEDGTEAYKKLSNSQLQRIINVEALKEFINENTGEVAEDWDFCDLSWSHGDQIEIDFEEEKNLIDLIEPELMIDEKLVNKLEFLEKSTYEHVVASLSIDEPKDLYKKRIIYYPAYKEEEFAEYDDPYSDEPPDYDDPF